MNPTLQALQNMSQGNRTGAGEILDWSYYDTLTIAAAGVDFPLFQVPVGQAGKTYALTNMPSVGIPNGQNFVVTSVRVEYLSHATKGTADIDTLYTFLLSTWLRIAIPGKDALFLKPLTEIMGIPILWHTLPSVAGNNDLISAMGRYTGWNKLDVPLTFIQLDPLDIKISYPTALGAISLVGDFVRVSLHGVLKRLS